VTQRTVAAHGGVAAAGHPATLAAALATLEAGGNAFDAAVAAGFASAVAEPSLTGLAGGGFLLAAPVDGPEVLFDFFVESPGLGARAPSDPTCGMRAVTIRFPSADQVFHAGPGSIATPGCLAGYLHVHRRLGVLPLADVIAPSIPLARDGTVLGPGQAAVVRLLEPIMTVEPFGRQRYLGPGGAAFADDQRVVNEPLAAFLMDVAAGRRSGFHDPDLAPRIAEGIAAGGGRLGVADLEAYRVIERAPLVVELDGVHVATNPPPSFGGELVIEALGLLLADRGRLGGAGSATRVLRVVEVLDRVERRHRDRPDARIDRPTSVRGTTHVSVCDREGNLATMTTSNGSTSGVHLADTGVMANNVMGEEDLHPGGLGTMAPGRRVGSMMAPTVLRRPGRPAVALGSGGSERIRSAITQVVLALVVDDAALEAAVEAPRLHVDPSTVQVEPGLAPEALAALVASRPCNLWPARDLYFGGVHAVDAAGGHVGDARRGGRSAHLRSPD
jgi:gamma-glutamyltranspeptidase / glutathione hydrolase